MLSLLLSKLVGKINEYFKVSAEVEGVIATGFKQPHADFYFAIQRLALAKTFFENNKEIKSSSSALLKIVAQLKFATTVCLKYLEQLLKEIGRTVEETEEGDFAAAESPLEDNVAKDIQQLCAALRKDEYFNVLYEDDH